VTRVVGSVGTDHHPYERMLDWLTAAKAALDLDVFVQRGATPGRDTIETVDYTSADQLATLMQEADVVVCHGGPGTISLAIRCGHRPIVMARDPSRGEHVDDHQMRYVARLAAEGSIDSVTTLDQLIELLRHGRERTAVHDDSAADEAVERFGELVRQLLDGTLPKRTLRQRIVLRREA
jgi:UDP-N-acetylglucosamine transferase subunit ALG13